jgi:hypothetical protein
MSDAYDYFKAHAIAATQQARALPFGRDKKKQRVVARVYHLLPGKRRLRRMCIISTSSERHSGWNGRSKDKSGNPTLVFSSWPGWA